MSNEQQTNAIVGLGLAGLLAFLFIKNNNQQPSSSYHVHGYAIDAKGNSMPCGCGK